MSFLEFLNEFKIREIPSEEVVKIETNRIPMGNEVSLWNFLCAC